MYKGGVLSLHVLSLHVLSLHRPSQLNMRHCLNPGEWEKEGRGRGEGPPLIWNEGHGEK